MILSFARSVVSGGESLQAIRSLVHPMDIVALIYHQSRVSQGHVVPEAGSPPVNLIKGNSPLVNLDYKLEVSV